MEERKRKMNSTKRIALSAMFLALGILIPYFFHIFGASGSIFLPMHIPVLLAGFFVGPIYGLIVGFLTPLTSGLLTGMPPFAPIPIAVIMAFELGAYGFFSGLFFEKFKLNAIISLILAMICGRILVAITAFFFVAVLGFDKISPIAFAFGSILTGLPGLAIQVVLIPGIVYLVKTNGLITSDKKA